jgi:fructose-1,6-bisphosphatase/inositol monophosphatase family enzyme
MTMELQPIERRAVEAFQRGDATEPWDGGEDAWVGFGLRCLLESGRRLRTHATAFDERVDVKHDGSPVTRLEREIEHDLRERLLRFEPTAAFVGEESGGSLPSSGFAVAVDPVDGTWAFLSETSKWACVIAVLRDGEPYAGFVANPLTGELAYALRGREARLLRLSVFGEPPAAHTLPTRRGGADKVLVSLHPGPHTKALRVALHDAWRRGELGVVRSPGGSPAWGLVEAARGHYVYLNAWSRRSSEPFDLVAGVLLVRSAGGEVVDASGAAIDATRHAGPLLAGVDSEERSLVAAIVRDSWPAG